METTGFPFRRTLEFECIPEDKKILSFKNIWKSKGGYPGCYKPVNLTLIWQNHSVINLGYTQLKKET